MTHQKTIVTPFALMMLMTGAVDGILNLPSLALFGQQLLLFFVLASLFFLIPIGLISAELCVQFKEKGGIYSWSKRGYGVRFGVLMVWLQWINTMVWFPTCLTTLTGTLAYLIDPLLAQQPLYLVVTSLSVFWLMTLWNLRGIKASTRFASIATMGGMILPMVLVIFLSAVWLYLGKPKAIDLNVHAIFFEQRFDWSALTAVMTAFLGMELATVHVKKIKNAHRTFPKALLGAVMIIILTMGLSALGVALVVPHKDITLVAGTVQAFTNIFQGFHLSGYEKIMASLLVLGSLGSLVNWLISPANGLAEIASDGYLPCFLAQENKNGVPANILILQACMVSMMSLVFFLLPSVNASYWFLFDLSTELYVMMYFLMFFLAIKLLWGANRIHVIPGRKFSAMVVCCLGLMGSLTALIVGFLPPESIEVGRRYVLLFSMGLVVMILPGILLCRRRAVLD